MVSNFSQSHIRQPSSLSSVALPHTMPLNEAFHFVLVSNRIVSLPSARKSSIHHLVIYFSTTDINIVYMCHGSGEPEECCDSKFPSHITSYTRICIIIYIIWLSSVVQTQNVRATPTEKDIFSSCFFFRLYYHYNSAGTN